MARPCAYYHVPECFRLSLYLQIYDLLENSRYEIGSFEEEILGNMKLNTDLGNEMDVLLLNYVSIIPANLTQYEFTVRTYVYFESV